VIFISYSIMCVMDTKTKTMLICKISDRYREVYNASMFVLNDTCTLIKVLLS
jgi:hypothetical protein